jgi:hypothetical protein
MGTLDHEGQKLVVRHGAPAQRLETQRAIASLMGADHMMPRHTFDAGVHALPGKHVTPHEDRLHAGTSYQELAPGDDIMTGDMYDKQPQSLRDQWKSGELHRLLGTHYIANETDAHGGNFKVHPEKGVQYYDADNSFPELPFAHALERTHNHLYARKLQPLIPTYVMPFVDTGEQNEWEGVRPIHKGDQPDVAAINAHAAMINPELFKKFGPHAHERAIKVKQALSSGDPTGAMLKLWKE